MGISKFPKLGLLRLSSPIILCVDLRLKWGLKQNCNPHQNLFNSMLHATCTQGNQVDSWLLVVGSQIGNLTPGPSFGHNLCFKCLNGSCELISDIYVLRAFQWYKELLNPLSFDPYNCPLKIWESIKTSTPKVKTPLGMWGFIPSHSLTLPGACNVVPELPFWPATLQALALVTNPRLGLWQWHKGLLFNRKFCVSSNSQAWPRVSIYLQFISS